MPDRGLTAPSPLGARTEKAIDEEVEKETGTKNFTEGMAKKGCELLPPSVVASTFDVPEDELEQMKMIVCIYDWKSGDEVLEANLTLAKARDSVYDAERWFENSTASKTKEELEAEMERVKGR